eukprot:IDg23106t1
MFFVFETVGAVYCKQERRMWRKERNACMAVKSDGSEKDVDGTGNLCSIAEQ